MKIKILFAVILIVVSATVNAQHSVPENQIRFSEARGFDYDPNSDAVYYNDYNNGQVVKIGDVGGNGWFLGKVGIGTNQLGINGTGVNDLVIGNASSSKGIIINANPNNDGIVAFASAGTMVARFIYNNPSGTLNYYKPGVGNLFAVDNTAVWIKNNKLRFSENRGFDYDPTEDALYYNDYNTGKTIKFGKNGELTVDGKIKSEEVKVEVIAGVGPDYVFEANYELRTLQETKEYITENKHLPEIPSAREMEANGIDLGAMNMRLLKKIEELTLYQIELLERLEKAEEKIQQLENK
ncbi:MAG: hypothetical protein NXI09_09770 [Bacteroidetes bacterium]|nr:hypothetical protein [Bacteroidota bacterium]